MSEPNFSQREGLAPSKGPQIKRMDKNLRNGLWNVISKHYLSDRDGDFDRNLDAKRLYVRIYEDFIKIPSDILPGDIYDARKQVKAWFYELEWNEVYDFVEFFPKFRHKSSYADDCIKILSREFSGYTFVSGKIIPIVSRSEVSEIEQAIKSPLETVNNHIEQALELLTNRKNPDYRNSIKKSISAVEAICRKIAGETNAPLGEALDLITNHGKMSIAPALKAAFQKLYGYSSSSQGIRHALPPELDAQATQEEAQSMLISCSAFVNYLIAKAGKLHINLK